MRSHRVRRALGATLGALIASGLPIVGPSAGAEAPEVALPDSYQMAATAKPFSLSLSAPAVLPIFVDVGLGVSSAQLNNQPYAMADAAPFYIPLLGALDLLGGPEGLVRDFLPEILLGIPSLWGGDTLPLDPETVIPPEVAAYLNELMAIGIPKLRAASCTAFWPQEPREVECGNPVSILDAIRIKEFNGKAVNATLPGSTRHVSTHAESDIRNIASADAGGLLPSFKVGRISSYVFGEPEGALLTGGAGVKVEDIDVLGVLKIDSVETSMTASMSGEEGSGVSELKPCEVKGLKLFGMPAKVTDHGLEFGEDLGLLGGVARRVFGEDRNGEDFAEKVQAALKKAGVSIEVRGTRSSRSEPDGSVAEMSGACVSIGVDIPVSSTQIKINIGDVGMKMSASHGGELDLNFGSEVRKPPASDPAPAVTVPPTPMPPMTKNDFVARPASVPDVSLGVPSVPSTSAPLTDAPARSTPQIALGSEPISTECGLKCVFPPFALLTLALPFLVVVRRVPGRKRFDL